MDTTDDTATPVDAFTAWATLEIASLQARFNQAEEQLAITRKGAAGHGAACRRVGLLEGQLRAMQTALRSYEAIR
jgi:hypothetical protein